MELKFKARYIKLNILCDVYAVDFCMKSVELTPKKEDFHKFPKILESVNEGNFIVFFEDVEFLQLVCTDNKNREVYGGIKCNGDNVRVKSNDSSKWHIGHVCKATSFMGWCVKVDDGNYEYILDRNMEIELIEEVGHNG